MSPHSRLFARLRRWITPPSFDDEEQSRVAGLLYLTSLALLAVAILTAVGSAMVGHLATAQALAVGALGPLAALWLTRRGRLRAAGFTGFAIFLGVLDYILYIGDGIHDEAIIAYPALIVLASLLLDRRLFAVYAALVVLSLQGIILGELTGLIVTPLSQFASPSSLIYVSIPLLVTIVGARFLADRIARNIATARSAQSALQESNRELRHEIVERARAEREVERQTEGLLAVNALAVRCATAPVQVDLWELIAEELKTITGALAVTITGAAVSANRKASRSAGYAGSSGT